MKCVKDQFTIFLSVYRQNMINYPPRAVLEGGCRLDRWFLQAKFADDVHLSK